MRPALICIIAVGFPVLMALGLARLFCRQVRRDREYHRRLHGWDGVTKGREGFGWKTRK